MNTLLILASIFIILSWYFDRLQKPITGVVSMFIGIVLIFTFSLIGQYWLLTVLAIFGILISILNFFLLKLKQLK